MTPPKPIVDEKAFGMMMGDFPATCTDMIYGAIEAYLTAAQPESGAEVDCRAEFERYCERELIYIEPLDEMGAPPHRNYSSWILWQDAWNLCQRSPKVESVNEIQVYGRSLEYKTVVPGDDILVKIPIAHALSAGAKTTNKGE